VAFRCNYRGRRSSALRHSRKGQRRRLTSSGTAQRCSSLFTDSIAVILDCFISSLLGEWTHCVACAWFTTRSFDLCRVGGWWCVAGGRVHEINMARVFSVRGAGVRDASLYLAFASCLVSINKSEFPAWCGGSLRFQCYCPDATHERGEFGECSAERVRARARVRERQIDRSHGFFSARELSIRRHFVRARPRQPPCCKIHVSFSRFPGMFIGTSGTTTTALRGNLSLPFLASRSISRS